MKHWLEREIAQWVNYQGSIWLIAPWVDALQWNYALQLFILWRKCWVIVPYVCVCMCMCMCIVCLYVCVSVPEVRIITVRETASSALYLITIVQLPLRVVPPGNDRTTSSLSWNINTSFSQMFSEISTTKKYYKLKMTGQHPVCPKILTQVSVKCSQKYQQPKNIINWKWQHNIQSVMKY